MTQTNYTEYKAPISRKDLIKYLEESVEFFDTYGHDNALVLARKETLKHILFLITGKFSHLKKYVISTTTS